MDAHTALTGHWLHHAGASAMRTKPTYVSTKRMSASFSVTLEINLSSASESKQRTPRRSGPLQFQLAYRLVP